MMWKNITRVQTLGLLQGLLTGILKACRDGELSVWTGENEVVDRLQGPLVVVVFLCGQGLALRFGKVM